MGSQARQEWLVCAGQADAESPLQSAASALAPKCGGKKEGGGGKEEEEGGRGGEEEELRVSGRSNKKERAQAPGEHKYKHQSHTISHKPIG